MRPQRLCRVAWSTLGARHLAHMTDGAPVIASVRLGGTDLEVSRMILGCASIGGLFSPTDPQTAEDALAAAWATGVRTFDTAPHYGVGLSEERLGAFLADKTRTEFVVSTKVGRLLVPTDEDVEGAEGFYGTPRRTRVRDYSRDGVRRSIEESCERLDLDRVDIALIHDPDEYWEAAIGEAYPALEELRSEGVVKAIGAGMNQAAMLERFVTESDVDCVLVAGCFSLIEESAATSLFPACREHGVSVLAAGVYESGILASPKAGSHFRYGAPPADVLARVDRIASLCALYDVALPVAALHYVLAHADVTAVVVGARSATNVHQNADYLREDVPRELFDELAATGLVAPIFSDTARESGS
jgi:D-threo-aldose 1-dehydrogenase